MHQAFMNTAFSARRQLGVTLVELMVTMVVAILVLLAATSGAALFEGSRRNSLGSNSALENGIATAFDLQREIQGAGLWGVDGPCKGADFADYFDAPLNAPVSLTTSGTSQTVTVTGLTQLIPVPTTLTAAATATSLQVTSASGVAAGSIIALKKSDKTCVLSRVTAVSGTTLTIQPLKSGGATPSAEAIGSLVFNFGPIRQTLYRIGADNFETVDLVADPDGDPDRNGTTTVLAENVVLLRAQYGVSADATSLAIQEWVGPGHANATTNRLRAVRIAVVSRAPQPNLKEKDASGNCSTTTADPQVSWATDLDVGATSNTGDARCFPYRVSSIVIPMKNYLFTLDQPASGS